MGHYFKCLMNDESPIIETDECVGNQGMTNTICEEEVQEVLGGTKCGKVVGGRWNIRGSMDMYGYMWGPPTVYTTQ